VNTSNFYAPQRLPGESFEDYKSRRRVSQRRADNLMSGINNIGVHLWKVHAGKPPGRVDRRRAAVKASKPVAPGPKFAKMRKRIASRGHAPTWPNPKSEDQMTQSRPLIVINPVWQLKKMRAYGHAAASYGSDFYDYPKHFLDTLVLQS